MFLYNTRVQNKVDASYNIFIRNLILIINKKNKTILHIYYKHKKLINLMNKCIICFMLKRLNSGHFKKHKYNALYLAVSVIENRRLIKSMFLNCLI